MGSTADIVARWSPMRRPSPDQADRRRVTTLVVSIVLVGCAALGLVSLTGRGGEPVPADQPIRAAAPPPSPESRPAATTAPPTTTSTGAFLPSVISGPVVGEGLLHTYRVEVEQGTGIDPDGFAERVEAILSSPSGWIAADGISLQRVAVDARIVVTLATAATVDLLCYPLETASQVSCAQPGRAIINLDRWLDGAEPSHLDISDYQAYVISHEVGHTLGHGHVDCPAPGVPAPVMMQQTLSIGDCAPNPWPVPTDPTDPRGG